MDLVIHHAKCPDGFCAAFTAKKKYPEAELLGLDHGEPVPFEQVRGKDVLVVDFSWPNREDNIELYRIAKSFHIYDHHKTALERLAGLDFVTFDMNRSGAGLIWDYLFGQDSPDACYDQGTNFEPRPWYVDYVEDRDLWRHALRGSKAVSAFIMSLPMTIDDWNYLDKINVEHAEQFGVRILNHIERYVKEAVNESQRGFFRIEPNVYMTTEVVNCPYMNCSEVGNVLAKKAAVGLTWFERADGQIQFSLRSEGDTDVSAIAKIYGGGGHLHAAGFRLPIGPGRELIDAILGRTEWPITLYIRKDWTITLRIVSTA
jgi:nanoRNase/pAp phosphatase (c-di-AMP/oligoRNAs hydrolase)